METIAAKTIVTRVKKSSEWFGIDYNMNIYRGCSHGCIYCDSRSACYCNPDFDTIKVKGDALRIIRDDLRRKVKSGVVATGAMSDPYNPLEEKMNLTRNAMELISAYGFGVAVDTKSALVTRDIDVLQEIKSSSPVIVKVSITTAEDDLCKIIEPNVASTKERFEAVRKLSEAGIFSGVLMMPILPFVNDTEQNIRSIVRQTAECGARFVYPAMGMTLREGNREYYYSCLEKHFPGVREKYEKSYDERYMCTSLNVKKLWSVFVDECTRHHMIYDMKSIIHGYKHGYASTQLSFFD